MKIRLTIQDRAAQGTLDDTPTARDLAALLPLRLRLSDYAAAEKVSDLPRRLAQEGAPSGYAPAVGDLTYYAPWGNLAIFTEDFRYAPGLIRLGALDSGLDALSQEGELEVTLELVVER